jgi:signal transduction histidine kinase
MSTDRLPGYASDVGLAVAVTGLLLADALLAPGDLTVLDYLLLLSGTLVLLARRHVPRTTLLITMACMLGYSLHAEPGVTAAVPVLFALYTAVAAGHRLVAVAAATPFVLGALASSLALAGEHSLRETVQGAILPIGWFVAAGVAGEVSRHRRAYLHQVEQRAAEAERTREETALRRAGEERLRIARELHDSLTHSISIIKVQAGVAVHLARKRGEEVPGALLAIQEAIGEAMRELRATLEVLRNPDDDSPPSGLDRLAGLLARARSAGLPATLTVTGQAHTLRPEIEHAVYRIVQEALTNITRHAGPASASVHIRYLANGLVIQVDDNGQAGPGTKPVPGVGLTGMRERVAALGGRLLAGPRPEGGFTVQAELPIEVRFTTPRPAPDGTEKRPQSSPPGSPPADAWPVTTNIAPTSPNRSTAGPLPPR